jgi:hypothetical protein
MKNLERVWKLKESQGMEHLKFTTEEKVVMERLRK